MQTFKKEKSWYLHSKMSLNNERIQKIGKFWNLWTIRILDQRKYKDLFIKIILFYWFFAVASDLDERNQACKHHENFECRDSLNLIAFFGAFIVSEVWKKTRKLFFWIKSASTSVEISRGTLIEKIKPVLTARHEFECRNVWKIVENFGGLGLSCS